jgi:glutamyl-tRNA synthetase
MTVSSASFKISRQGRIVDERLSKHTGLLLQANGNRVNGFLARPSSTKSEPRLFRDLSTTDNMTPMTEKVRVRYAPSPTGEPHLGNIRSALFNWLYARASGGTFIVRIEDTDRARLVEGAQDAILDALRWLNLDWDEGPEVGGAYGPYVQSERQAQGTYQVHTDRLIAEGHAYYCYCLPDRLDAMRKEQQAAGQSPGYDRRCRALSDAESKERLKANANPVVRFKMPLSGEIVVNDRVRGEVKFDSALLDDFVILKSDGFPTYHLANVVDDHLMEITHVMRAEEWLPSAPRHLKLYEAFGFDMPQLVHLPIILGPDRSKLSKRHGATSVLYYRDDGYLSSAMLNFLARLGWSLDDSTEILSREELVKNFTLERILANPAVFDKDKLEWMNGLYIRVLPPEALTEELVGYLEDTVTGLPASVPRPIDRDYLKTIVPLERERIKRLSEAPEMLEFFFIDQPEFDPAMLVQKGVDIEGTRIVLERAVAVAETIVDWNEESLEAPYRALSEELSVKAGQLFGAIRVAITGRSAAPPLFETMAVLGRDRCLSRMRHAVLAAVGT